MAKDRCLRVAVHRTSGAAHVVKLAFELLVLTAARWGEVRGAEWAEIDTSGRVWTIPATRMKAQRAHRVPLCGRAMEILEAARALGDGSGPLLFPNRTGTPLPEKKLRQMLQDLNIAAVPHGFWSTFRDWAAERTNHPREVVEAALAHTVQNKVEAAYARSDLFERRRRLMDDYMDAYMDDLSPWAGRIGGPGTPVAVSHLEERRPCYDTECGQEACRDEDHNRVFPLPSIEGGRGATCRPED